jgi:hypothetical protein
VFAATEPGLQPVSPPESEERARDDGWPAPDRRSPPRLKVVDRGLEEPLEQCFLFWMDPAYRKARFRVTPPQGGLPRNFSVITACNPDGETIPAEENAARTKRFSEELRERGLEHFAVTGFDPDSGHAEPGFGILCGRELAVEVGRKWGQEAVFVIEHGELWLLACDGDEPPEALGSFEKRIREEFGR